MLNADDPRVLAMRRGIRGRPWLFSLDHEHPGIRAALDVTDPEPLPPDHPLWGLPNVLISPHMAGDSPASTIRSFELAGDQVRRFAAGEPVINEVARYLLD